MNYRIEQDYLGKYEIPNDTYSGINTARATNNFPLSDYYMQNSLYRAMALVKKAAALTNYELGYLEKESAFAICRACEEIFAGRLEEFLKTNAMQGGAGTSTNMNINEVIANRALEILGYDKGTYRIIHPIEQVNLHQSANDVFPTSLRIALIYEIKNLIASVVELRDAFQDKENEFADILTIGRTEFQDSVPITLGSIFGACAEVLNRDKKRFTNCLEKLAIINMGGTAVGTGLTAPKGYMEKITDKLKVMTGLRLSRAENLIDSTTNNDVEAEVMGNLVTFAANCQKFALDIRFMHYQNEIRLQDLQMGSSITPGKINPVIPEAVISIALKIKANSVLINEAVSIGTLQFNEYLPIIAYTILESVTLLTRTASITAKHIRAIQPNRKVCKNKFENSHVIITAFLPYIGFEKAEEILHEYDQTKPDSTLKDFLKHKLGNKLVEKVLSVSRLMGK